MTHATLCVETSIVSYLTARPSRGPFAQVRQAVTKDWWRERRRDFDLVVSEAVTIEASRGDPNAAALRLEAIEQTAPAFWR